MKFSIKIKNKTVSLNVDDDITQVEMEHIQSIIENDIKKLEKEVIDTLTLYATLIAKYCVDAYIKSKKLSSISTDVDRKLDEIIRTVKEYNSKNTLF